MSALCQLCGLPMFEGAAGYVGPQCMCLWVRLPTMQDAIEAGDGTLHGSINYWQKRCAELEAYNATRTDELLASTQRIAELEAEVNRLNNIYDEIELRALMAKDSSGKGRTLLERLESNFTELCEARDSAKRRISELERKNAELKRLWFSDADPSETVFAAEYAAIEKIKEAS